jgi:hypothetical protein
MNFRGDMTILRSHFIAIRKLHLRWVCFVFILILSVNSARILLREIDAQPHFICDELQNVQASTNFCSGRPYWSEYYHFVYSSGIASTWPAAVGWKWGHTMFAVRVANAVAAWLGVLLLGFLVLWRIRKLSVGLAILVPMTLWAAAMTSPFALPYWHGFLLSLGEVQSGLLIGCGYLLLFSHPVVAAFVFGAAVWHGKFLYILYALGGLVAYVIALRPQPIRVAFMSLSFVAPLILFLVYYSFKFDGNAASEFMSTQMAWIFEMRNRSTQASFVHFNSWSLGLIERLQAPNLEWTHYSQGQRAKMIILGVFPIGFGPLLWVVKRKAKMSVHDNFLMWTTLGLSLAVAAHAYWYFFLESTMGARYLQPAMYVGCGLYLFWGSEVIKNVRHLNAFKLSLVFLLIGVIALQSYVSWSGPLFRPNLTYARKCIDLYGPSCNEP